MRNLFATGLVAVAIAVGGAGAAQALEISSTASGWVNSNGTSNGAAFGNNTFTGNEFGARFNSWAAFDVPVGAFGDLELILTPDFYGASVGDQIGIYDVSTDYSAFEAGASGIAGYLDLGDGSNYGSFFALDTSTLTIALGGSALANFNSSAGGKFILGFTNLTKNATPSLPGQDDGVYTNPNGDLKLRFAEATSAVPEPGAWAMMIVGFGAIGSTIRLRRRTMVAA